VAPRNFDDYDVLDGYAGSTTDIVSGEGAASEAITVTAGAEADTVDIGFYQEAVSPTTGRLAGYVWDDANEDGIFQDETETAFDGVSIRLYRDSDGSGDLTTADELAETTVTFTDDGRAGAYVFENLDEGAAYLVQIPPENFDEGGALAGYSATGFTSEYGVVSDAVTGGGEMTISMDLRKEEKSGEGSGSDNCFIATAADGGGFDVADALMVMLMLVIGVVCVFLRINRKGCL
jgi:hypothetical protein